ncbi:hypothetical protein BGX26_010810 [Mortierella sp. AD094]|nr:hypothetical protein BGX26_010810 [Mortierella sp. AD094]
MGTGAREEANAVGKQSKPNGSGSKVGQRKKPSEKKRFKTEERKDSLCSKVPNFLFHMVPTSTLRKSGKIYVDSHQDWYSEYRRHRGTRTVFRKLDFENPRRSKATFTVAPVDDDNNNDDNELRGGSGGSGTIGGNMLHGEEKDGDDSSNKTQSIQSVKKPKFVGPPVPSSVRHTGLIPKARSDAIRQGGWSWIFSLILAIGVIASRTI